MQVHSLTQDHSGGDSALSILILIIKNHSGGDNALSILIHNHSGAVEVTVQYDVHMYTTYSFSHHLLESSCYQYIYRDNFAESNKSNKPDKLIPLHKISPTKKTK